MKPVLIISALYFLFWYEKLILPEIAIQMYIIYNNHKLHVETKNEFYEWREINEIRNYLLKKSIYLADKCKRFFFIIIKCNLICVAGSGVSLTKFKSRENFTIFLVGCEKARKTKQKHFKKAKASRNTCIKPFFRIRKK